VPITGGIFLYRTRQGDIARKNNALAAYSTRLAQEKTGKGQQIR
jgi:hypothetical protein